MLRNEARANMAVYTQSEQFADKIAIRKNSRFERSFLLACLISPTKRSLPSSRPTPRESTKKRKKKSLLNQQCKREFAPTFTLFEEGKGSRCTFLSSSLLSHLSRNAFEILFHKTEKKKLDYLEGNRSAMFRETVENHRFND